MWLTKQRMWSINAPIMWLVIIHLTQQPDNLTYCGSLVLTVLQLSLSLGEFIFKFLFGLLELSSGVLWDAQFCLCLCQLTSGLLMSYLLIGQLSLGLLKLLSGLCQLLQRTNICCCWKVSVMVYVTGHQSHNKVTDKDKLFWVSNIHLQELCLLGVSCFAHKLYCFSKSTLCVGQRRMNRNIQWSMDNMKSLNR